VSDRLLLLDIFTITLDRARYLQQDLLDFFYLQWILVGGF
jgi:hypothetical protein